VVAAIDAVAALLLIPAVPHVERDQRHARGRLAERLVVRHETAPIVAAGVVAVHHADLHVDLGRVRAERVLERAGHGGHCRHGRKQYRRSRGARHFPEHFSIPLAPKCVFGVEIGARQRIASRQPHGNRRPAPVSPWTQPASHGTLGLTGSTGARGKTMHPIISTTRSALLGAAATGLLVTTANAQINDSIRGAASEANHFIATPKGWKQPKTPWGEPDITSTLNMMQTA